MVMLTLKINGHDRTQEVEGRTLLVDFLRGGGLTGTHVGCETSQCGACTVHMNGAPVKACSVFALEAEGADVTTIEGMAEQGEAGDDLSVIQAAFKEHHGLQCGFCTPGMIMSAAALLKDVAQPTEAQIRSHLEGNICRCTGYHNIVKAIMAASGQDVSGVAAQ
ncbi:(2Fe-2S)-binding protein [Celeribacter marinus]|uniref:(2Fe-2S)-binding protein n=1 Tax=Celeribacter marinus TaxID=1397108 RepID=UPI003F6CF9C9